MGSLGKEIVQRIMQNDELLPRDTRGLSLEQLAQEESKEEVSSRALKKSLEALERSTKGEPQKPQERNFWCSCSSCFEGSTPGIWFD